MIFNGKQIWYNENLNLLPVALLLYGLLQHFKKHMRFIKICGWHGIQNSKTMNTAIFFGGPLNGKIQPMYEDTQLYFDGTSFWLDDKREYFCSQGSWINGTFFENITEFRYGAFNNFFD